MQYNSTLKLVPLGVGMLFLAATTSGCAVDATDAIDTDAALGICDEDDTECQLSQEWNEETIESAQQEWRRRGLGLRPDLWGRRFLGPRGNPWVIGRGGFRHRIPDIGTYGNLWGHNDLGGLGAWDGLGGIPMGTPFAGGARLAGVGGCGCGVEIDVCDPCGGVDWWDACDPCGGEMYLVNAGYRHSFRREVFEGYGFGMGGVERLGWGGLDGYPGADWRW